jgi:hypothetical protein
MRVQNLMAGMAGRLLALSLGVASLVTVVGCPYSFTGASVPKHLKTIAIPLVDDQSGFGEPRLRENFTAALTDLFVRDNTLELADRTTADALLEGSIVTVTDAPAVVAEREQVTKRQITMAVRYVFQDMKLKKKVWEKTFTEWGQYESGGGASQRTVGLDGAIRKITENILLETVSGW